MARARCVGSKHAKKKCEGNGQGAEPRPPMSPEVTFFASSCRENLFSKFCFSHQLEHQCTPVACECPGVPATSRGCVIPNQASARRESAAAEPGGLGEAECPWRAPESATSRGPWESGLREWQRHG